MLTYGWKQQWIDLLCNAMKNHALQQRTGAVAVPLSPSWQVCSATWQLCISMINAVVPGLPVTKLKSALLRYFKVKWMSRTSQTCSRQSVFYFTCGNFVISSHAHINFNISQRHWCPQKVMFYLLRFCLYVCKQIYAKSNGWIYVLHSSY